MLANLLNNAAKYTAEGGAVTLTALIQGDRVRLEVADNGTGIAANILPRVFDLFAQANRTLERSEGGLGIGLTLVRRIAEMHDGRVEAFSEGAGRGSTFVVHLPVMQDAEVRQETGVLVDESDSPPPPPRRILLVEDNRGCRRIARYPPSDGRSRSDDYVERDVGARDRAHAPS